MAVTEEREIWTNAPPTGSRRHVAYFGFERSTLSLVSSSIVRQAAEDIKTGRPALSPSPRRTATTAHPIPVRCRCAAPTPSAKR